MTHFPSFNLDPALAAILATVLDAAIIMTPDGLVAGWNERAESTFGWTLAEVQGRYLGDMIVPPKHRAAHRDGLLRMAAGAEPRVLNRRIEITGMRRDGTEFPIELSITTAPSSSGSVYVGFIRDISDRRMIEAQIERQAREARLMFDIATMAAESDSFDEALRNALEAICKVTGWPVGHAFVVPPGNQAVLQSSGIWVEAVEGAADILRAATEISAFGPGVGLPGRIFQTGEPEWICDTDAEPNFPRKGKGFLGAFGFPLKQDGRIIAILEFFSQSEAPPEDGILLTVRALDEQVGRVFERKRTQDRQRLLLRELDHRVKNIFSVVQAVAQQTFRRATSVEDAAGVLRGRLVALAQAQDVLVQQNMEGAGLREIVLSALVGSGVSEDQVEILGAEVRVSARNAATISLAIHELCTNALKYGALSSESGVVRISWGMSDAENFRFEWRESGGPQVSAPNRTGFGTSLLERGLAAELGGDITLHYDPSGVVCVFQGSVASAL